MMLLVSYSPAASLMIGSLIGLTLASLYILERAEQTVEEEERKCERFREDEFRDINCSSRWVIGESYEGRTEPASQRFAARAWQAPELPHDALCAANEFWLRGEMMNLSYFIDIGIDENRAGSRSPYYELEWTTLLRSGYPSEYRYFEPSDDEYEPSPRPSC